MTEPSRPERFRAMIAQIRDDAKARGDIPRNDEEVEAERQAFREEWDERRENLERIHLDGEALRETTDQPRGQPQ